jgi:hypothetical protein
MSNPYRESTQMPSTDPQTWWYRNHDHIEKYFLPVWIAIVSGGVGFMVGSAVCAYAPQACRDVVLSTDRALRVECEHPQQRLYYGASYIECHCDR